MLTASRYPINLQDTRDYSNIGALHFEELPNWECRVVYVDGWFVASRWRYRSLHVGGQLCASYQLLPYAKARVIDGDELGEPKYLSTGSASSIRDAHREWLRVGKPDAYQYFD